MNCSLVVPGESNIVKVELFNRPFLVSNPNDIRKGNIMDSAQGITSENFMNGATLKAQYIENITDKNFIPLNRNKLVSLPRPFPIL